MATFYIIFLAFHFIMCGMLTGAILTNMAEAKSNPWTLYVNSIACFAFGIYFTIALLGYSSR